MRTGITKSADIEVLKLDFNLKELLSHTQKLEAPGDEWSAAIGLTNDAGHTAKELSEKLGVPKRTLAKKLKQMMADGRCICGHAIRENAIGRMHPVPVYRLRRN